MRLFFAIELSDAARAHLVRVQEVLRGEGKGISWTKPANLHITLKFLGEVDPTRVAGLCESAATEIQGVEEIRLRASGLLFFPPRRAARVVAAEMAGDLDHLGKLYEGLEAIGARHGFTPERRRYRPHVTLARPRQWLRAQQQALLVSRAEKFWPGPDFGVVDYVLMESKLAGSHGAKYLPVARFPIRGFK